MTTLLDLPRPSIAEAAMNLVDALPSIDVDTLTAEAALMTRRDRKYLIPSGALPEVLAQLRNEARVLEIDGRRQFGYHSHYLDTPELTSYLLAARRRQRRFKVRTRTYLDTDSRWVEVKLRDRRRCTHKVRIPWTGTDPARVPDLAAPFLAEQLTGTVTAPEQLVAGLAPALATSYQRTTLYLPGDASRVTIDAHLTAHDRSGRSLRAPDFVIIETKGAGPAGRVDRVLWSLGQRPIRISKYATCLALLHPTLPATAWRPALRRLADTAELIEPSHLDPKDRP